MTNSVVGALRVNLGLDSAQFSKGLKDAQNSLAQAGRQMRNIGAVLSVAVTAPLTIAAKDALRLARVQESAQATVEQAVKSTAGAAGFAAEELFKLASGLQETTKFGDEDILGNVTAQLLTFTNIAGDEFERAQQAILDVSTVMKTDLKSSAIQLGKALNDPVKGLSALSESGIQFTEDQKELIKSLVEAGDIASAQGVILDELSKQFGGQAATAAQTLDGKIAGLSNSWGDLKEEFGALLAEFLPPIIDALRSVISFVQDLDPKTKKLSVTFGLIAAALGPVLVALGLAATAIAAVGVPVAAAIAGVGGLTAALVAFGPEILAAKDAVLTFAGDALVLLQELPDQIVAIFAALPAQMAEIGREILAGLLQGLRDKYQDVKDGISGFASGLVASVKDTLGIQSPSKVFREIGENIMEGLSNGLSETGAQVRATMGSVTDGLRGDIEGLFRGVLLQGKSFKSALSDIFGSISGRIVDRSISSLADAAIGAIPGFAAGTNYAPGGLALVGERGPELVHLPRSSRVEPNPNLGGTTIVNQHLTFQTGRGDDPRAIAEQVRPMVRAETLAVLQRARRTGRV